MNIQATPLAETAETAASAETPELILAVALIGVLGIALGGLIQLVTQRWVIMYDRMIELRKEASTLCQSVGSYSSVLVQSAGALSGIRLQLADDIKKNPKAELDFDEDYWNRLSEAFFNDFKDAVEQSTALQIASDYRLSSQATDIHLLLVETHNEAAEMFTGKISLTEDEAKALQKELNDAAGVLLNMVGPRWWEGNRRFRSAGKAKRIMLSGRKKRAKKAAKAAGVG